MVARPEGPDLAGAPLPGAGGHRVRVGPVEPAARLGEGQLVLATDGEILEQGAGAERQYAVEVRPPESFARAFPPGSHRHPARQLVYEPLSAVAELVVGERERQEAHPAVDVVADASGGDDAVRRVD